MTCLHAIGAHEVILRDPVFSGRDLPPADFPRLRLLLLFRRRRGRATAAATTTATAAIYDWDWPSRNIRRNSAALAGSLELGTVLGPFESYDGSFSLPP